MAQSIDAVVMGSASPVLVQARAAAGAMIPVGRVQENCARHGVFMATGTRLSRRVVWTVCPGCAEDARRAEVQAARLVAEKAAAAEREKHLLRAAIPARFVGRTFDGFKVQSTGQAHALAVSRRFVSEWSEVRKRGAWLVFSGPPGTGKSHLAGAILQALMPGCVGRYMTCMELIQLLRSTWRRDSDVSEVDLLDSLAHVPLLVIDEIGVQYGTESEQTHLFDVLDRRYREMKPTILLTNQDAKGFRQFVGDRVYDRMTEVARWVPCNWGSYRKAARMEMGE